MCRLGRFAHTPSELRNAADETPRVPPGGTFPEMCKYWVPPGGVAERAERTSAAGGGHSDVGLEFFFSCSSSGAFGAR